MILTPIIWAKRFAILSLLLVCLLAGCTTPLRLETPPLSHGIRGKSGEFLFSVVEGPELPTLGNIAKGIDVHRGPSPSKAASLAKAHGADRLFLGSPGPNRYSISSDSGVDWVAATIEKALREAGYAPKRVAAVESNAKLGMRVVFKENFTTSYGQGLSEQVAAIVGLDVNFVKAGVEVKKGAFVGKAQMAVGLQSNPKDFLKQSGNALSDAVMQVFRVVRDLETTSPGGVAPSK